LSAIAELRSATWSSHQHLEKRLDVKTRFTNAAAYRAHLEKMWGFCGAIERRLGHQVFGQTLADYESRRKVPLLTRDLVALGASIDSVTCLPLCEDVPDCPAPACAFGCLYVLEGATLGGRTLLPLVESRLGLSADSGAAFLASYGEQVGFMWRAFGASLDAWCTDPPRRVCASRTAVATFESLSRWLCGDPR
jgi:heme oxygenase (biliverdin-IX-beta and delta-forming)